MSQTEERAATPQHGAESGPASALLQPEEHVLSTLESDGSRRWITPRLAKGRFWHRRRIVAYALLALYSALPWIRIGGEPAILLDIAQRRFVLFGGTFLPTDTVMLALAVLTIFLGIFFVTAIFGRVWCGWACPQTVYMEFVFRPIERLFTGKSGVGGRPRSKLAGWRRVAMYAVYLVICLHLAQTFVAYFVGVENVQHWIWQSPAAHPIAFAVVVALTVMMMIDFAFWREQLCIIGCPYGRLQSVLLDRNSLIVSYDTPRGEPRGHVRKSRAPDAERELGDCVDCGMCVAVCPTGIDIRNGLQLECIHCTQCADACDHVMDKVGRPTGLIRYSSQSAIDGESSRIVRPRVVIYLTLIVALTALLVGSIAGKPQADVTLLRSLGSPFVFLGDEATGTSRVQNTMRLKIRNRTEDRRSYLVDLLEPQDPRVVLEPVAISLAAGESLIEPLLIVADRDVFADGPVEARVAVTDDTGWAIEKTWKLLGPRQAKTRGENDTESTDRNPVGAHPEPDTNR